MPLITLILTLATTTQPSPDLWATHCLENVFRDTPAPSVREPARWSGARDQWVDAQIVLRSDMPLLISGVSCSVLKQATGATIAPVTFEGHFIDYQPVKHNSSKTPPD